MASKKKPATTPPVPAPVPTPKLKLKRVGMDQLGIIIYQGVMTLVMLAFIVWTVGQVNAAVEKSVRTTNCVLSVLPEDRTPQIVEECSK